MELDSAKMYELNTNPLDYEYRFDDILSRTPDARTLDTYAEDAFDALVGLIEDIVAAHQGDEESDQRIDADQERAALASAGLDPFMIEQTLTHIANVAESTRRLDSLIEQKMRSIDSVVLPPDRISESTESIRIGDGSFELPKEKIEKLKALLLVLEKGLGIDIESNDTVTLREGALLPTMMRRTSYTIVQIEPLARLVLSCDEIGNATFVLDTGVCSRLDLTPEDIAQLTKADLKALLENQPNLGTTITYSPKYMEKLATSLTEKFTNGANTEGEQDLMQLELLRPDAAPAPAGYLALKGIYKASGITDRTLGKAVDQLADQLGERHVYKFGSVTAIGYSPSQQQMLIEYVRNMEPPAGYRTAYAMARAFNSSKETIEGAIAALGDQLGEVEEFRFSTKLCPGFSPEQQQMIFDRLNVVEKAPDGYISIKRMAGESGTSRHTISRIIEEAGDRLGEIKTYRSLTQTTVFLSPEQQRIILDLLSDAQAPEGYLPVEGMRAKLNISFDRVKKAIDALDDQLGDVSIYRYENHMRPCYSPAQQDMIAEYLEVSIAPPEGFLTISGMARRYGSDNRTIKKVLASLREEIGEVASYRFGNGTSPGYSPEQQRIILQHLKRST